MATDSLHSHSCGYTPAADLPSTLHDTNSSSSSIHSNSSDDSFPIKEWTRAITMTLHNQVDMDYPHFQQCMAQQHVDEVYFNSVQDSSHSDSPADLSLLLASPADEQVAPCSVPSPCDLNLDLDTDYTSAADSVVNSAYSTSPFSSPSVTNDDFTEVGEVVDAAVDADAEEDEEAATATATEPRAKPKRKRWASALPPCRVCAQPASGLHYGLNTCEACKVFFRRCLQRKRPLRCKAKTKNCVVRGVKRVVCAYCRYQLCLTLGMSRDSIKLGRYTFSKRNENSQEILKQSELSHLSITDEEVEQLMSVLLKAHKKVYTNWDLPEEERIMKARQMKEKEELERELIGHRGNISPEEYEQIYLQTGLDVDGRARILQVYADCMERQIHGFVHFTKGIPGFRDLPLDDQANLLKAARAELLMLGIYRGYVHQYDCYVNPDGICFYRPDCMNVLGPELQVTEYSISRKLRRLNALSKGEMVLVKAICVMYSDRCELQAKDKVDKIQWRMMCALLRSLDTHHKGQDGVRLSDIVDCLTELRLLNHVNRQAHDNTSLVASVLSKRPILVEVLLH